MSIEVESRSNWISKYLDYHDCSLFIDTEDGRCEIIGVDRGVASCYCA